MINMEERTVTLPCPYCEKDFGVKPDAIFDGNILTCPNCSERFVLDVDRKLADEKLKKLKKTLDSFSS